MFTAQGETERYNVHVKVQYLTICSRSTRPDHSDESEACEAQVIHRLVETQAEILVVSH